MPVYTYRCRSCEYEFDRNQRMSEAPLVDCPSCGEPQLRKVLNSVGVVFKGSGFYVTDNRNGAAKAASKNDNANKAATESKSDGAAAKSESSTETAKNSAPVEKAAAAAA